MHLFGHIHKFHGTTSDGVTVFSNAAIMDEEYEQGKVHRMEEGESVDGFLSRMINDD